MILDSQPTQNLYAKPTHRLSSPLRPNLPTVIYKVQLDLSGSTRTLFCSRESQPPRQQKQPNHAGTTGGSVVQSLTPVSSGTDRIKELLGIYSSLCKLRSLSFSKLLH